MKKILPVGVLVFSLAANAQQASLVEACAKIGDAVSNPAVMSSTVLGLSADDQLKFVAQVNAAIAKMPGSAEVRAAAAVDANRAALSGARKGSLNAMLAEVFATAPLDALPVMNEVFASDLFNRSANPAVSYTDEQFVDVAKKALEVISARNADVDNGAVRTGFAILMFVRASNGTPAGLADVLSEALPKDAQNVAKNEWFPAALAQGDDKSYDPMLLDVLLPNEQVVLRLAHAQSLEALLGDLTSNGGAAKALDAFNPMPYGGDRGGIGAGLNNGLYRVPFAYSRKVIGTTAGTSGSGRQIGNGAVRTKVPMTVTISAGAEIPAGAVAGTGGVQVVDPSGQTLSISAGSLIPPGSRMVGGAGGSVGTVVLPAGTILAPGGMPTDPMGRPVAPGGQVISSEVIDIPSQVQDEPTPYRQQ